MRGARRPVQGLASAGIGRRWPLWAGLFALAFAVRLVPVLIGGGLHGYGQYDGGVYYAASDALIHGRWPYRDFVLLHPPGLMLLLTPFAWLGRASTDGSGYALSRLAFMAVGALNTVLVALLARRWGPGAAVVAGGSYAVWKPAVRAEQSVLLEPLGTTALLVALLLLLERSTAPGWRAQVLAGIVLGASATLKIWYLAPWAAVVLWQVAARRWRSAVLIASAGAGTVAVLVAPFAVVARTRMFDMVIRDQLLRPSSAPTEWQSRLQSIFGIPRLVPGAADTAVTAATLAFLVVLAVAIIGCLTARGARVLVFLFAVNLSVLLLSPSYFKHYAHLVAGPTALVLAVGIVRLATLVPWRAAVSSVVVLAVPVCMYAAERTLTSPIGFPLSSRQLAAAAPPGCVASDSVEILILLNRLSSDLSAGCRVPVDVSGITYDRLRRIGSHGTPVRPARNAAWQAYLYDYLVSERSFTLARGERLVGPGTYRALLRHRLLARSGRVTLRAGDGPAAPSGRRR